MYEALNLTIWSEIKSFISKSSSAISAFLRYYAALSGNGLPNFRESLLVPCSRVRNQKREQNMTEIN
jgi:hypothetical protein